MANFLSTLTYEAVQRAPGASASDRTRMLRTRLIDALKIQIDLVAAEQAGKLFQLTGERYAHDDTGKRIKIQKDLRIARWHFTHAGNIYTQLRYGSSPMTLNAGGSSIRAGESLQALSDLYSKLIVAVGAGELDKALEQAAAKRSRKATAPETAEAPTEALQGVADSSQVGKATRARNKG